MALTATDMNVWQILKNEFLAGFAEGWHLFWHPLETLMTKRDILFTILGILAAFFLIGFVIKLSVFFATVVAVLLIVGLVGWIIRRWIEG